MLDEFIQQNPELTVNQTVLAWGAPYYTKLAMASVGGRAPDAGIMHVARLPGYAPGGLLDSWDLDLFAELGVTEELFPPKVWEKGLYQGELKGVCLDMHPFVLYFNTEVAAEIGQLGDDDVLTGIGTEEDFKDTARRMAEVTGGHGLAYGFLGDPSNMWRMFSTWYTQMGGTVELPEGGPMQIDEDKAIAALEWMVRSEEHTSELQSRGHLVCRLLLD